MTFLSRAALVLFLTTPAFAHGPAEWIQRENWKNALGELYCGEHDCVRLEDGDVRPVEGGYYIKSLEEFVPLKDVLPVSPDGFFRCQWGGMRKCFFAPFGGV